MDQASFPLLENPIGRRKRSSARFLAQLQLLAPILSSNVTLGNYLYFSDLDYLFVIIYKPTCRIVMRILKDDLFK